MAGYLVLARKYRPTTFEDVLGQSVVTSVLRGALTEGRIGQAYLFSGPRGTGKTTTARILARCLNCVNGPTATPCGTCEHCTGIDAGNDPDLIEIDAATHTGVDHVRELREQANYAPMNARYKVYLVDEVHMLSKAAFNALLKTLEEPPPHVVFLFATTELHKVLPTITSRCQVLKLKPLDEGAIVERLREVLKLEGVSPGPGLLEEIARSARGGMRDALSLTDKLLALAGNEPTLDDLSRLGGHTGSRELEELCNLVEAGDRRGVLEKVAGVEGAESDLVAALLEHLRLALVAAFCGGDSPMLPSDAAARDAIVARGKRLTGDKVELWMQELLHARERMRLFPGQERMVLELTLLDLARPETTMPIAELEARLQQLSSQGVDAPVAAAPPPAATQAPASTPAAAPTPKPAPTRAAAPAAEPRAAQAPPAPTPPAESAPAKRAPAESPAREASAPPAEDDGWEPEPDPSPALQAERQPTSRAAAPTPAPVDASNPARVFASLVQTLSARYGALSDVLSSRGSLEFSGDTGLLSLQGESSEERAMITDRRNLGAIRRALQEVLGRELSLRMKGDGPAGRPDSMKGERPEPTAPKSGPAEGERPASRGDAFTNEVADLFGGVIEDLG